MLKEKELKRKVRDDDGDVDMPVAKRAVPGPIIAFDPSLFVTPAIRE